MAVVSPSASGSSSAPDEETLVVGEAGTPHGTANAFGPGDAIGRYLVLAEAGRGGMGQVLRAYDPKLRREVALKLVHMDVGSRGDSRILAEAQAMAKLSHPSVVPVYDVDTARGVLFIAMEYVAGTTLRAWLRREPRGWREVLTMFMAAGRGLAAAHTAGLVHRDFKPDNVLVGEDDRVRVTDFGLALTGSVVSTFGDDGALSSRASMYQSRVMGTPAYMAPEQHEGADVSPATDQYAFCVALFEGLYGQRPFAGASDAELLHAKSKADLKLPSGVVAVPRSVHRAILRGMSVAPEDRWPSMDALLTVLGQSLRSGRRLAFAAGGAFLVMGAAGWLSVRPGPQCEGAGDEFSEVWNDTRRESLAAALSTSGVKYAEETKQRVLDRLDRYAMGWSDSRRDACEATAVRKDQSDELLDLRMMCLDRRRSGFATLVDVLETGEADVVRNAATAVDALASLDECSDRELLLADVRPPSEELRADVEGLRRDISRSEALSSAGKFDEAYALAKAITQRAESLEYPPALAEALVNLAWRESAEGDYADAAQTMRSAYFLALSAGHTRYAATAATRLVFLLGERLQQHAVAYEWAEHARALLERGQNSPTAKADLLFNLSATYTSSGDGVAAEAVSREAIELVERADPDNLRSLANYNNALGHALHLQGKYGESADVYRRSIALFEQSLGPHHPDVAAPLSNLASSESLRGNFDGAVEMLERALEIQKAGYGPEHPKVALVYGNMAAIHLLAGRPDVALPLQEESLRIYERALGAEHAHVVQAVANRGLVLSSLGRQEEAERDLRRAIEISTRTLKDSDYRKGLQHNALGALLMETGRLDEAGRELDVALQLLIEAVGPSSGYTGRVLLNLGRLAAERGELERAESRLRDAYAIYEVGEDPSQRALVEFELAKVLWELDRHGEARSLAAAAIDDYRVFSADPTNHTDVAKVQAWLDAH